MKKALQTLAVWMLTLACCVAFAACGHEHTFATEWSQDSENHWHACTEKDCTEVLDKTAHAYDNACDADCNVCGATRTVGEHVYDNACDTDCNICGATRTVGAHTFVTKHNDTKHWQECSVCNYTKDEGETHSFETKRDATNHWQECACGYTKDQAEHSFGTEHDATNHWQKCACGYTKDQAEHSFGTEHDTTNHWQECACGYTKDQAEHSFGTEHDATNHWQECACGYTKDQAEHSFGTEHDATNHWQKCACGYTKDQAEHSFGTEHDATNHWQECACGYKKDQAAHAYDNACDTDCNICGATRTVGEHAFEPKHDKTNHWQECSICKYEKDKAAHTYGDWTEKTAADYGVDKVETRTCSKCSYADERIIKKSRLEYTGDFYMMIAAVTNIPGKGVSVSGTIARGTIKVGDKVSIGGYEGTLTVQAIEKDKTAVQEATYSDEITVLLGTAVSKDDIAKGQPLYKPGSLTPHTTFIAEIYVKTAEEGGRSTAFFDNYKPQFNFNGSSVSGTIKLSEGETMVLPGSTVTVTVVLANAIYLWENVTFVAQEGGKTVITGKVVSVKHIEKLTGDAEGHWTVCADCGIALGNPEEKAEHSFSWVLNYETHNQKCDDCGYETKEEEHTYEAGDETECENCHRQREEANLAFQGGVYTVTYNGQGQVFDKEHYLDTNVSLDEVTVYYSTSTTGPWTTEPPKDAGSYYVRLQVEANHAHTGCDFYSKNPVFVIEAKRLAITELVLTRTPNVLTSSLNKTVISLTNADISEICGQDALTVSLGWKTGTTFASGDIYTIEVKSVFATTHAEKYVTIEIINNNNYTLDTSTVGKLHIVTAVISYNSETGAFQNVTTSFGADETQWFAFELTKEMIDDCSDEINIGFTATPSSGTLTLKVVVYDKANVEKGGSYCEELTAGKYFIKITASEACNITLSISFG